MSGKSSRSSRSRLPSPRSALAAVVAGLLFAACGPSAPAASSEAGKTADEVLADAQAAMRRVHSYRVDSSTVSRDGSTSLSLSFDRDGGFQGHVAASGVAADVVVSGGEVYLRGHDFWSRIYSTSAVPDARLQAILARLDDHFVHDRADVLGLLADSRQLTPTDLPDCIGVHGRLSLGGLSTFGGLRVVVVDDDGSQPGGSHGRYMVADAEPHRLLHAEFHGAQTVGQQQASGHCPPGVAVTSGDVDPSRSASFSFSQFDAVGRIGRPADAVEVNAQ